MVVPAPLSASAARTFQALLARGVATRPELSSDLGLSKQTISLSIEELERRSLAEAMPGSPGSIGRTALSYALNRGAGWVAGIDLGSTRVRVVASRLDGTVLDSRVVTNPRPTPSRDWPDALDFAAGALADLVAHVPEWEGGLFGLAIAVPRPIDELVDIVADDFDRPDLAILAPLAPIAPAAIWVENDVNCAALAHSSANAGEAAPVLYLKIGAGVGAALVANGAIVRGVRGRAGEVRRLPAGDPADGVSVEDALSATGLLHRAGRAPHGDVAAQIDLLYADADRGDEHARQTVQVHAEGIAALIDSLSMVIDPRHVVLAGYLGDRPEVHSSVARALTARGCDSVLVRDPLGDSAAAVGAAGLASTRILAALTGLATAA